MATSIFGIGLSGLSAAQLGLVTTGHNISNANTPGYHRQEIAQSTYPPQFTGAGFVGQGVKVDTINRIYNEFLETQVSSAETQGAQLDNYYAQIKQIDNMLADPSAGLSPALQEFFKGVQDVAANPASVPSRQLMLSGAQTLVARFQTLNSRFQEIRDGLNSQVTSSVGLISSYAQGIASLNQQIVLAESASSSGQPANDLRDQREQLIAELNQEIKVSTVKQSDGAYNIFIGNGQALVVGAKTFTLAAAKSPEDPERLDVAFTQGSSTVFLDQTSLQGGKLGSVLAFRSETLDGAQNALGRVAAGLAQSFNDQHRLGQDLNGALGGNLFNLSTPKVFANNNNTSGAVVTASISSASALTTSDYSLRYDGANYTLTRVSDNTQTVFAAFPQTVDGVTLALAGAPAAGESWLIEPTRNGAKDFSALIVDTAKIAAAAPIAASATLANTGSGKISAGTVNTPPPPNSNLQQPVTITFTSATTFNVTGVGTGNPVGVAYTAGANISYNGWTVQISGAPAAGDTFAVGPNTSGVADNRNALLLAGLQTRNTLAGGTTSYQGAYSQLVGQVGNKTREVEVTSKAQQNLVSQTRQAQQSMSGVNLDEEAANLLRYQQAYQAAGKMIQIANTLFDTLIGLGAK